MIQAAAAGGFNGAARMIERMEREGSSAPWTGPRPREVRWSPRVSLRCGAGSVRAGRGDVGVGASPFPANTGDSSRGRACEEVVERVRNLRSAPETSRHDSNKPPRIAPWARSRRPAAFRETTRQMRWEYQTPDPPLCHRRQDLVVYSPSEKQVMVQDVADAVASPVALRFGETARSPRISRSLIEQCRHPRPRRRPGIWTSPKRPEAGIARMLLEVNTKGYTVGKDDVVRCLRQVSTAIAPSRLS
jgi:hypothetical protein